MNESNIILNCLNCNNEFNKKKNIKDHKFCCYDCKKEYTKNHPKIEQVICSNCNIEYNRRKQSRYKNNYCSLKCEKEFKYNLYNETRNCNICNNTYQCLKTSSKQFCSIQCQGKWQSTQVGILNPRFTSELVVCDWCKKETYKKQYIINNESKNFCCTKCRQDWYSNIFSQSDEWKLKSQLNAVRILESGLISQTNSGVQKIVNEILNDLNIEYINEKGFNYCAVDNYLVNYNLIIEVMGGYWHCDNRFYPIIPYEMQVNRIRMDKIKHTNIKKDYNIEILYLWENDILKNKNMCTELIKQYINKKGILSNYHSFNYEYNKMLILNDNLIIPYMEWDIKDLNNIIDISVKEKMSKKQNDKWITYNCDACGKEKEQLITHYNKNTNHYCSIKCASLSRQKRYIVKCNNCNNNIEIKKQKYNMNKRFFCNQNCQHEYQKNIGFKKDNRDLIS